MIRTLLFATAALALASPAAAKPKPPEPAALGAPSPADWRTPDPENVLVIDTSKGRILVEMTPEAAPAHVVRVRELARAGFYDGRSFFRVINDFMAQTGDPKDDGTGGSDKPNLPAEFTFRRGSATPMVLVAEPSVTEVGFLGALPVMSQSSMLMPMTADGKVAAWPLYCPGVAAMARAGDPNSANSQFFLMRQAYPSLERNYTAWGRAISGLEVIRAIKTGEPVEPPRDIMTKVRVLADLPDAERLKVRVIDPAGAWFKAQAVNVRTDMGASFTPCAIPIPVEVK